MGLSANILQFPGILSGDIHDKCDICDIFNIRDIHDICDIRDICT